MKALLPLICLLTILAFACKKDDPAPVGCGSNWVLANEIEDELNAVLDAATTYTQDPTTANCEAYVAAYQDYLDELEGYQSCANQAGQGAEYQQALQDAQDALDDINC